MSEHPADLDSSTSPCSTPPTRVAADEHAVTFTVADVGLVITLIPK